MSVVQRDGKRLRRFEEDLVGPFVQWSQGRFMTVFPDEDKLSFMQVLWYRVFWCRVVNWLKNRSAERSWWRKFSAGGSAASRKFSGRVKVVP